MKPRRWSIGVALVVSLALVASAHAQAPAPVEVEVFTREGCPRCHEAKGFLAELRLTRPWLQLRYHDVERDAAARERLASLAAERSVAALGVPAFLVRGQLLIGFSGRETSGRQLLALIEGEAVSSGGGAVCPATEAGPDCAPPSPSPARDTIDAPWVGQVSVRELGLLFFTVLIGLIDGFNPCAMWVLLMAAWLNVFLLVGFSRLTQVVLGLVALGIGLLNVKDFAAFHRGPTLSIPERAKPGLYARTRRLLEEKPLLSAMGGVVVLALLVNPVELACTAGLRERSGLGGCCARRGRERCTFRRRVAADDRRHGLRHAGILGLLASLPVRQPRLREVVRNLARGPAGQAHQRAARAAVSGQPALHSRGAARRAPGIRARDSRSLGRLPPLQPGELYP